MKETDRRSWWLSLQKRLLTGSETIVGVWCHAERHYSLCTLRHSQARHLLIGGLALKPSLHGHQQAFTIAEKKSTEEGKSTMVESKVEGAEAVGGERHGRIC